MRFNKIAITKHCMAARVESRSYIRQLNYHVLGPSFFFSILCAEKSARSDHLYHMCKEDLSGIEAWRN